MNFNHRAYRFFLVRTGVQDFLFGLAFTVQAVYFILNAKLDPLQLVLVGTVLEASCFIFEVPTGIVADVYSRRLSVLIGIGLWGLGFLIEGFFPFFGAILVAQVVMALGYTFNSGALQAWIADEVGEENVGRTFLRASQVGRVCSLAAIIASVGLGSINPAIPILLAGVGFLVLTVYGVVAMPETGFKGKPKEERQGWREMRTTFKAGTAVIRTSTVLVLFMLLSAFAGASSEGQDRLWEAHFLKNFTFPALAEVNFQPVIWFGIINVVLLFLGMLGTYILEKRVDTNNRHAVARLLMAFSTLQIAFLLGFALAGNFAMAFVAFLGVNLFRGLAWPLYNTWLTQSIEPRVRATVLSMVGQSDAIGQMVVGPVLGWIGTVRSIRAALVTSALFLAPVVPLVARARNRVVGAAPPRETLPTSQPAVGEETLRV